MLKSCIVGTFLYSVTFTYILFQLKYLLIYLLIDFSSTVLESIDVMITVCFLQNTLSIFSFLPAVCSDPLASGFIFEQLALPVCNYTSNWCETNLLS